MSTIGASKIGILKLLYYKISFTPVTKKFNNPFVLLFLIIRDHPIMTITFLASKCIGKAKGDIQFIRTFGTSNIDLRFQGYSSPFSLASARQVFLKRSSVHLSPPLIFLRGVSPIPQPSPLLDLLEYLFP